MYEDESHELRWQIAEQVRDRMIDLEWTQRDLAERMMIQPPTLCRILNGHQNLNLHSVQRLADALGCLVDIVFTPVDSEANQK